MLAFASMRHHVWLFLQICRESKSMNLYGVLTRLLFLNWKILCGFIYHPRSQKGRRGWQLYQRLSVHGIMSPVDKSHTGLALCELQCCVTYCGLHFNILNVALSPSVKLQKSSQSFGTHTLIGKNSVVVSFLFVSSETRSVV